MTAVNWSNPYERRKGVWLKGNLHAHSAEGSGCSQMPLKEALKRYDELKYDFLCVSDHMRLTQPRHKRLIILPGIEWNSENGTHTQIVSFDLALLKRCIKTCSQPKLLEGLAASDAITVFNHPNWQEPAHYSKEMLFERKPAMGMEIYNAVIERLVGCALATDKWDYLLSRDRPILGFASDDSHLVSDVGQAWIMVRATARNSRAIAKAILEGNFYPSAGVTIKDIRRNDQVITVDTADADEIWAIGSGGMRLAVSRGKRMVFDASRISSPYVRFTAFGRGSAMAWTQPFFLATPPAQGEASPFVKRWFMSELQNHRLGNAPAAGRSSPLGWKPAAELVSSKGFVNAWHVLRNRDGVVYFTAKCETACNAEWILSLGHDGGVALFVDGERVIFQPHRINPAVEDRSQVRLKLTRGTHEITVCLDTDHGLGQGFFFRFIRPYAGRAGKRAIAPFPRWE